MNSLSFQRCENEKTYYDVFFPSIFSIFIKILPYFLLK